MTATLSPPKAAATSPKLEVLMTQSLTIKLPASRKESKKRVKTYFNTFKNRTKILEVDAAASTGCTLLRSSCRQT